MIRESVDVLVIGSGFAGSLTALLLHRSGRSVALVDNRRHPRFAIGESSTPLADLILRSLCEEYDLPQFLPLCDYGQWKHVYPELVCGEKRGFSYFHHQPGEPFQTDARHSSELLVTANRSRETADTHWLRSDVDHFFAQQAAQVGVLLIEGAELQATSRNPWRWEGAVNGESLTLESRFTIDASGGSGVVARATGAAAQTSGFQTESHALFAHVEGLEPWQTVLERRGIDCSDHPFCADRAAVHHLLGEGWMWQLSFDNNVTSVGLVLEGPAQPVGHDELWHQTIARYPTILEQFRDAHIVSPGRTIASTKRLQRRWKAMSGDDWILLPSTAGFIDPLHSVGIAHSLSGVERVVRLLQDTWGTRRHQVERYKYERDVARELRLIDALVAACYATRSRFDLFTAATMLYFVAAITCEERRLDGGSPSFLATDDERLCRQLHQSARRLIATRNEPYCDSAHIVDEIRNQIEPWNACGLLRPQTPQMYLHTGR